MISHCQTITGGLDIEVSGFNAQVKIDMFWTLTLWICAAPKYWYPLEICFSKDDTLLGKPYMSIWPKFNWGIKAMSLSLWLNATIWQHSFVGHTQCASFWLQMHYSWAPYQESPISQLYVLIFFQSLMMSRIYIWYINRKILRLTSSSKPFSKCPLQKKIYRVKSRNSHVSSSNHHG